MLFLAVALLYQDVVFLVFFLSVAYDVIYT